MSTNTPPRTTDPIAAARALAPQLREASAGIEREQRIPQPLFEAVADAGLFKLLVPRSLGGGEVDLSTFAQAVEEVAKGDASVAWCVSQANGTAMRSAYVSPAFGQALVGPRLSALASGTGPIHTNRAVVAPGGYRVTGEWGFASGGHHSTWMCAESRLYNEDGSPILTDAGKPVTRTLIFPATEVAWKHTWDVSGLRGTGSDTYIVNDLFVPAERTCSDQTEEPLERGPLYQFPIRAAFSSGFASVAFGIVRSMLDAFEDVAQDKVPRAGMVVLKQNAVVQSQVARAEAQLRAARAYMHQTLREAHAYAEQHGTLSLEQRVLIRLATTHAIQQAAQVGDAIHMAAGATAVFASSPFERWFRDLHAVTAHVQGHQIHYETTGQFFLGIQPEMAWL